MGVDDGVLREGESVYIYTFGWSREGVDALWVWYSMYYVSMCASLGL